MIFVNGVFTVDEIDRSKLHVLAYFLLSAFSNGFVVNPNAQTTIKTFQCHFGDDSRLPKTKHFFKKLLGTEDQNATFHFYCKNCTFEKLKSLTEVQKFMSFHAQIVNMHFHWIE